MTTTEITDPRPIFDGAIRWVQDVVRGTGRDQLDAPTPCPEFDVRTLIAHIVAVLDRITALGRGENPLAASRFAAAPPEDDWARALAEAVTAWGEVWHGPEGEQLLDRMITVPFGTVPGRTALLGYASEILVHGWDLAVAGGQDAEADPAVAEPVFAAMRQLLPAEPRGGPVPFDAPVAPREDAGPTERLANWCGRRRP